MDGKSLIISAFFCGMCLASGAQEAMLRFNGKVTDQSGKGIPGVVVNDGVHFTKTDKLGAWALNSDTAISKFVAISTPDRKSTRLNSSHSGESRMPSSA